LHEKTDNQKPLSDSELKSTIGTLLHFFKEEIGMNEEITEQDLYAFLKINTIISFLISLLSDQLK
jgi:hypothetical protein